VSRANVLRRVLPGLLAATLALAGCAAGGPAVRAQGSGGRATLAMLPLENLSGRAEYGERFSRLVWGTLGRTGRFDVVDPGEVDGVLVELRIRSAGSLTTEQVLKAAGRLKARWIVAGTLLECGTVHTPDGDLPSFGLALRVLDGRTGKVVWTDLRSRTGQDRETIFGWGREENLDRLAQSTANELIDRLRTPESPDSLNLTEGTP
jgi:hypothetical protein